MKFKILLNAFLLISFLLINNIYSQNDNTFCGWNSDEDFEYTMPFKTPVQGQYVRALIIYVTFPDDYEQGPLWNIWPNQQGGSPPVNPYTPDGRMIDHDIHNNGVPFMNRCSPYTYSDWFCQMSMGEMDFIGDEYHIELPLPSDQYARAGYNWISMNRLVLQQAKNTIPNLNFANYDKWTQLNNNNWAWGSDGTAEMIIIHYRRIPHNDDALLYPKGLGGWFWTPGNGGVSGLGIYPSLIFDGVTIGRYNGITAIGNLNRLTRTQLIVEHELGHIGGLDHHTTGLMTPGSSESAYILDPIERNILQYIDYINVQNSQNYQDFTLRDYVETGDVLLIYIEPTFYENFLVTNNQKKSRYDGLSRGSNTCWTINRCEQDPICTVGKGLFIYHAYPRPLPDSYHMDLESSDGYWSWELDRIANVPELGGYTPLMRKTLWDPNYGKEKFHQQKLNPNFWSPQTITDDPCSDDPNGVFNTEDYHSSGHDAFNKDYDEIFSPYSNPNTNSFLYPTTNSGISIRIVDQNQTGDITVRVYFNDGVLADSPPSKPKGVQHEYYFLNGNVCVPKITWHHNMEPNMLREGNTKRYQIWRATAPNMANCPNFNWTYSLIYQGDFDASVQPFYIDNTILEYTCAYQNPPYGTRYPVSYKIKAVDAFQPVNKISVYSDSAFTTGITPEGGRQNGDGGDNIIINNIPKEFKISQNYPNPFNPVSNIKYDLPKDIFVSVKIYDLLGREIKTLVNEFKQAGSYIVSFNGSEFASGIYFYRIQVVDPTGRTGSFIQVKKMILIK